MSGYILKLFISGHSTQSERAISAIQQIVSQMDTPGQLIVIDVLKSPEQAEEERVLATPTLLRVAPPPSRRIIGDITDPEQIRQGLGL